MPGIELEVNLPKVEKILLSSRRMTDEEGKSRAIEMWEILVVRLYEERGWNTLDA